MQTRQMRETFVPVLPRLVYSIAEALTNKPSRILAAQRYAMMNILRYGNSALP